MKHLRELTVIILASAAIAAASGCSGSSTGPSGAGGAGSVADSASPSPRQTQPGVATAAPSAPSGGGGGGDFCATQGEWLDVAAAYAAEIGDDHDLAVKYMDLAKRTNDLAPAAIKEDVLLTVGLATAAVEGPTGVTSPVQITPQAPERFTAAAGAVKDWTKANCSAEIAAKWDAK